jgi:hypothetical protein
VGNVPVIEQIEAFGNDIQMSGASFAERIVRICQARKGDHRQLPNGVARRLAWR